MFEMPVIYEFTLSFTFQLPPPPTRNKKRPPPLSVSMCARKSHSPNAKKVNEEKRMRRVYRCEQLCWIINFDCVAHCIWTKVYFVLGPAHTLEWVTEFYHKTSRPSSCHSLENNINFSAKGASCKYCSYRPRNITEIFLHGVLQILFDVIILRAFSFRWERLKVKLAKILKNINR